MNRSENSTLLDAILKADTEGPKGGAVVWLAVAVIFFVGVCTGWAMSVFYALWSLSEYLK